MGFEFDDLPHWEFTIVEMSVGIYRASLGWPGPCRAGNQAFTLGVTLTPGRIKGTQGSCERDLYGRDNSHRCACGMTMA
jgi:hypothetical protein